MCDGQSWQHNCCIYNKHGTVCRPGHSNTNCIIRSLFLKLSLWKFCHKLMPSCYSKQKVGKEFTHEYVLMTFVTICLSEYDRWSVIAHTGTHRAVKWSIHIKLSTTIFTITHGNLIELHINLILLLFLFFLIDEIQLVQLCSVSFCECRFKYLDFRPCKEIH